MLPKGDGWLTNLTVDSRGAWWWQSQSGSEVVLFHADNSGKLTQWSVGAVSELGFVPDAVSAITTQADGSVLLASRRAVARFDPATAKVTQVVQIPAPPLIPAVQQLTPSGPQQSNIPISRLAVDPSGRFIAVVSFKATDVQLVDSSSLAIVANVALPANTGARDAGFAADGALFVALTAFAPGKTSGVLERLPDGAVSNISGDLIATDASSVFIGNSATGSLSKRTSSGSLAAKANNLPLDQASQLLSEPVLEAGGRVAIVGTQGVHLYDLATGTSTGQLLPPTGKCQFAGPEPAPPPGETNAPIGTTDCAEWSVTAAAAGPDGRFWILAAGPANQGKPDLLFSL